MVTICDFISDFIESNISIIYADAESIFSFVFRVNSVLLQAFYS